MTGFPQELQAALAGHYAIERELGRGGMAVVYLARDLRHDRPVALKVVRPELAALVASERFLAEIQIAARLSHPHVLPLHDSGEAAGLLYYVMPYVEGESLRQRLTREGQLPVRDALRIAREVADALDYAHRHGVVHRDVKPENILLADGHAVIADFGIARAVSAAATGRLTETGLTLGTPEYMSPEQATGEREIDGRSDIFSLGCVLYTMLAGEAPFRGPTPQAVMLRRITGPAPSLSIVRPSISGALERAVMTALASAPADRFQTAQEFGLALEAAGDPGTRTHPIPSSSGARPRRVVIGVTGFVVIATAVAAAMFAGRNSRTLVVEQTIQLTHGPDFEFDPAISPDGKLVAYVAGSRTDQTTLYVRQIGGVRAVPLAETVVGVRLPRWSPEGGQIAFHARDGIYIVPALGGPARRVVEIPEGSLRTRPNAFVHSVAWSPDGAALAYASDDAIFVLQISEGTSRRLTRAYQPHALSWSPDGSLLAYTSDNAFFSSGSSIGAIGNIAPSAICVVSAQGGTPVMLTDRVTLNTSPAWLPDARTLLFISSRSGGRDIYSLRLRRDGSVSSEPVRLTTGLNAHSMTLSADGRRLGFDTFRRTGNIWSVQIDERRTRSLVDARAVTQGDQIIEEIDLSSDGRWLAFDSNVSGNQDIYRIPANGGEAERLTQDPSDDFDPSWSPDGRELAFYSTQFGTRDIFVMNADGSARHRVTDSPGQEKFPDWSPDGKQLVYSGDGQLYLIARDSSGNFGQPRRLTKSGGLLPEWSPDGRWIAYYAHGPSLMVVSPREGHPRTIVSGIPGERQTALLGLRGAWSSEGPLLYYQLDLQRFWSIRAVPATGGTSRVLLEVKDPSRLLGGGFVTDGHKLYFTIAGGESNLWMLELRTK